MQDRDKVNEVNGDNEYLGKAIGIEIIPILSDDPGNTTRESGESVIFSN
jgi:hypothetical protein